MLRLITVAAVCSLLSLSQLQAQEAKPKAGPGGPNLFGIKPEGITSEAMRTALSRLQQAGIVTGRRGSLTFFRWSNTTPPKLAQVGLWGTQINDELFSLIAEFPDLENVALHETSVTDAGLSVLLKLTRLRNLTIAPVTRYEKTNFGPPQWSYPFLNESVDRPRITGSALVTLQKINTLESLNLLDVQLKNADLAAIASWPKLSSVALPNAIDAETVKHLQSCKRLTSLTLGHREITAAELTELATWKSLRKLNLVHAQLANEALAALGQLPMVEELHLEDCNLTDEHLQHFVAPPKLKVLGLERNEIAGPGLKHLKRFRLLELGVEFNNLSDATLSHLPQLDSLEVLGLSYSRQITDAGIRQGTLQSMQHLKELRLRGLKQVTDASLQELSRFGHLQHIGLRETGVSWDSIPKLKEALPKTEVFK